MFNFLQNTTLKELFDGVEEEEERNSQGVVCVACHSKLKDELLRMKSHQELRFNPNCMVCEKPVQKGVLIEALIEPLRKFLPNHYELAIDKGSDTKSMKCVVRRFFNDDEALLKKLISILTKNKNDKFFKVDGHYKSTVTEDDIKKFKEEAREDWDHRANELKHTQRFTNKNAIKFYEELVASIRCTPDQKNEPHQALTSLPAGSIFYRGRLVTHESEKEQFSNSPQKTLGPVPLHLAGNNRLSPPGVSFMYTANDYKTVIAELHAFVGDIIAIGAFKNKKELKFFDFVKLMDMTHGLPSLISNPKKDPFLKNRYFLHDLHALMSKPFRANDTSYIEMQTFAEVIRNYEGGFFDGIIFSSSQRPEGFNYVLFGKNETGSERIDYGLKFDEASEVDFYHVDASTLTTTKVKE